MEINEPLTVNGPLVVKSYRNGELWGTLSFEGNELQVISHVADASKVRIDGPQGGAVSFNVNGVEVALWCGGRADDLKGGGEIQVFCLRRNNTGSDIDMRRVGIVSVAYTDDGEPVAHWLAEDKDPVKLANLGKFA